MKVCNVCVVRSMGISSPKQRSLSAILRRMSTGITIHPSLSVVVVVTHQRFHCFNSRIWSHSEWVALRNPMPDPRCKFGVGCTMVLRRARHNVTCGLDLLDIVTILANIGIFPLVQEVTTATQRHSRDIHQSLYVSHLNTTYTLSDVQTSHHSVKTLETNSVMNREPGTPSSLPNLQV
jgi:hypothetical protein